jgi:hypothetical protein
VGVRVGLSVVVVDPEGCPLVDHADGGLAD